MAEKEYIERQVAIDALNKALFEYEDVTEEAFRDDPELDIAEWFFHRIFVQGMSGADRGAILNLPAADVRPVVLCKDCKYYFKDEDGYEMCENSEGYDHVTEDGFCAWAKKREGS